MLLLSWLLVSRDSCIVGLDGGLEAVKGWVVISGTGIALFSPGLLRRLAGFTTECSLGLLLAGMS